jgi:signal transduction histidine kinase
MAKNLDSSTTEWEKRYADLVEIARLVSWCIDRDLIVRESLRQIQDRLGKRARCCFLEDGDLVITHWVGKHKDDLAEKKRCLKQSIVWDVFKKGVAVNLTDRSSTDGFEHTLREQVKNKAIIPLEYVDALTQQEKRFGVLIVDSGRGQAPVSQQDFEYLQMVGDLIGEAVGKAELVRQLIVSYRRREEMVKDVAHCFRNRMTVIGGFAKRIAQLSRGRKLKREGEIVAGEIRKLENELSRLEEMWKTRVDEEIIVSWKGGPGTGKPGQCR